MKWSLQSLIAILFVISTITTSLHELAPHHDSSNCQICTLVQHDSGLVPEEMLDLTAVTTLFEAILFPKTTYLHQEKLAFSSRAPPLFS